MSIPIPSSFAEIVIGEPRLLIPAAVAGGLLLALVIWSYRRAAIALRNRTVAAVLKILAIAALLACLLDPRFHGTRPRIGANAFAVVVDNSQSMSIRPDEANQLQQTLSSQAKWRTRLAQDFDVRNYTFDAQLRHVADFEKLSLDGCGSSLSTALETVADRLKHRPTAGILLFTDGNATDIASTTSPPDDQLVPVYPVVSSRSRNERDLRVRDVHVSQSDFEASPTTVSARVAATGMANQQVVGRLVDQTGKVVREETATVDLASNEAEFRFRFRPETLGISFFRFESFAQSDAAAFQTGQAGGEVTFRNNTQTIAVDRGEGPYRVLYVAGRPSWDFKFLRRALNEDPEIELLGLVRIAKKEPKFAFRARGRVGDQNQLFEGFTEKDDTDTESFDQPVLVRLGVTDQQQLRDGFPKSAAELFTFHAVVIDDLEAAFLTADQMLLLRQFVSQRGGGLLMMGGKESFSKSFDRTAFGDLLPVYIGDSDDETTDRRFRWTLTREGMLQPWARTRTTNAAEEQVNASRPELLTVNSVSRTKPGATELAVAEISPDLRVPLLVTQRFGQGRTAALLVGDMWRWSLQRPDPTTDDLAQLWRQMIRWLVADSLRRVDVETSKYVPGKPVSIKVTAHDENYQPLDNARVAVEVSTPDGRAITIDAAAASEPGVYIAEHTPRDDGGYRVTAVATAEDGSAIGKRTTGWVAEPSIVEFQSITLDRERLEQIAERTGGEVVEIDELDRFVSTLSTRKVPITDPWIYPIWHQPLVLGLVILCLCGEWGLRRWKGLP